MDEGSGRVALLRVDQREPDKIFKYLEELGIPYERTTLELGDFDQDEVLIERKSVADFVQSFRQGHLQHQLARMEESGKKCFLVISGSFEDLHFNPNIQLTVEQRLGMLASIASRFNVKMVAVSNDKQLCKLVPKLVEKATDGKEWVVHRTVRTSADTTLNLLMCVPKIGLKKAEAIKLRYPTIRILVGSLEEGSFECSGIGEEIEKNLRSSFGIEKKEESGASPALEITQG